MNVFDYIVVGGGTAGCVLANRLTEDHSTTVLLLEAGGRDTSLYIHVPLGMLQIAATYAWQYMSEPDESTSNKASKWLGGKVLGGSSSVNGGVWTRGDPADFDEWAQLGCTGWDYESVLPYFKRAETFVAGGSRYRGDAGPVHVSYSGVQHPLTDAFVQAAQQVGHPFNDDYNAAEQEGVGYTQVNQRRGWRRSTARAYLAPARRRRNLTVGTNALATRILFEGDRATGVEYRSKTGETRQPRARREVIVAAGAIESPKLLQLSGIGSSEQLRPLGIALVHDNPAVGRNLQEHPGLSLKFKMNIPTLNRELTLRGITRHGLDFVLRGKGAVTAPPTHAFLFGKVADDRPRPDYELMFIPSGMIPAETPPRVERLHGARVPMKEPAVQIGVLSCHPKSRGTITLRSAGPEDPPIIKHQVLSDDDIAVLITGARRTREIMLAPALRSYVDEELLPGHDVQSDAQWEAYARSNAHGGHHPIGTCKMGADPEAVVDPNLSVHGVAGLRVVDASVMPTLISGHTVAPTIMIAERAADLIRAV